MRLASRIAAATVSVWSLGCGAAPALQLPPRPADAMGGAALEAEVRSLDLERREARIAEEILAGNVPAALRTLVPVDLPVGAGAAPHVTIWVAIDYLSVGSASDRWLTPLSPTVAQMIADSIGMALPTPRLVDAIWSAATTRFPPSPIDPSPEMTTTPVFLDHTRTIEEQRRALGGRVDEALVAGHKKDVVVSAALAESEDRVAIYGWHRADGRPIQPLYLGHAASWVDYSHGVRLISRRIRVDGEVMDLFDALRDEGIAHALSNEGVLHQPWYGGAR